MVIVCLFEDLTTSRLSKHSAANMSLTGESQALFPDDLVCSTCSLQTCVRKTFHGQCQLNVACSMPSLVNKCASARPGHRPCHIEENSKVVYKCTSARRVIGNLTWKKTERGSHTVTLIHRHTYHNNMSPLTLLLPFPHASKVANCTADLSLFHEPPPDNKALLPAIPTAMC